MKKLFIGVTQILLLFSYTLILEKISALLHLKVPGSILGLILLFILLQTKVIKLKWIEVGGNWLVAELLLFFIPSAVGVIQYKQLLINNGIQIIVVIFVSSLAVMIGSGLLADKLTRQKEVKVNHADTALPPAHH